jgi:hypothetical protein
LPGWSSRPGWSRGKDPDPDNLKELQAASEAFADRVPWEDEPEDEA